MYLTDWWLLPLIISGRDPFSGADLWHRRLWDAQVSEAVICSGTGKMSHQCEALDEGF